VLEKLSKEKEIEASNGARNWKRHFFPWLMEDLGSIINYPNEGQEKK